VSENREKILSYAMINKNYSYAFNVGWAELAKPNSPSIIKFHLLGFASSTQPTVPSLSHQNIIHRITGKLNWKRCIPNPRRI